ncbi:MAG: BON domain-containing protein [Fimbriimonadaceae bacterium]|nr:BON domain-containing protein [Chthonomonadaceae bacterium]MCO5297309.1 BON domain-containing protein [Fimbriimonadaceae bacterium]
MSIKFAPWPILALAAVLYVTAGCDDTAAGAAKDTKEISQDVEQGADRAAESTSEAARSAVAATVLTPEIKGAIVANPLLNDPGNAINVESDETSVRLTGTVKTEEMKDTAGQIAQRILDEQHASQALSNELKVVG